MITNSEHNITKQSQIIFSIPYFNSYLIYKGIVLDTKGNRIFVEYETEVDGKVLKHTTEIPKDYVIIQ